jgi:hypothetical protein
MKLNRILTIQGVYMRLIKIVVFIKSGSKSALISVILPKMVNKNP